MIRFDGNSGNQRFLSTSGSKDANHQKRSEGINEHALWAQIKKKIPWVWTRSEVSPKGVEVDALPLYQFSTIFLLASVANPKLLWRFARPMSKCTVGAELTPRVDDFENSENSEELLSRFSSRLRQAMVGVSISYRKIVFPIEAGLLRKFLSKIYCRQAKKPQWCHQVKHLV